MKQIVRIGILLLVMGIMPVETLQATSLRNHDSATGIKMGVSVNDTTVIISMDGDPIVHYRHKLLPAPAGQADKFARSGFIHPLNSPSGECLTWAQPADHLHHMGLWNPWTRATWKRDDGSEVHTDFWNLGDEQGTVRFNEINSMESGDNYAGFTVTQDHIAFVNSDGNDIEEIVVIEEEWQIKVTPCDEGYILDFVSLLTNNTKHDISLDAYRYGGGLGYRATGKWNNTNSSVLTSEGKTWENGDATRADWCIVSGDLEGINTGLLFMNDPTNYDSPQPMRIWPNNSNGVGHQYFEFTPIREKAWIIEPGKEYSQKYRIVVYEGEMSAERADEFYVEYTQPKVLIYTKNGEGFVHNNIQASVDMLKKICDENGIAYEVSDDPSLFTVGNLMQYDATIFTNTNNDAFANDDQRDAFKNFIQNGGGFVGIHSACGSERNWPWFWKMLGGTFVKHPPFQEFDVKVIDADHPSTMHFDDVWKWEDEAYYLHHLYPGVNVLLAHDLRTIEDKTKAEYPGTIFGDFYPGAWCHKFDGGVSWYTSYGHKIEHYSDPNYIKHIKGGLLWVLSELGK